MPLEWPARWRDCFNAGAHFLYPECCQFCEHHATPAEGYVCAHCWKEVRFIVPPFCERCGLPFAGDITTEFECANCHEMELHFSHARSAVVARGGAMEAIQRFKYNRARWFEPFLADLLVRAAGPELRAGGWDLIVPVPLHPAKLAEREFNQAERLARRLADATDLELHADLSQITFGQLHVQ